MTGGKEVVVTDAVKEVSSSVRWLTDLSPLTLLCALSKWEAIYVDTTKPRETDQSGFVDQLLCENLSRTLVGESFAKCGLPCLICYVVH